MNSPLEGRAQRFQTESLLIGRLKQARPLSKLRRILQVEMPIATDGAELQILRRVLGFLTECNVRSRSSPRLSELGDFTLEISTVPPPIRDDSGIHLDRHLIFRCLRYIYSIPCRVA